MLLRFISSDWLERLAEHAISGGRDQGASRSREGNLPPELKSRRMMALFPPVSWTPGFEKEVYHVP